MHFTLPLYELRILDEDGKRFVWDPIRKKKLVLTSEEYVRQCLVIFLQEGMQVPKGLISIEKGITVHEKSKRYDLVVYDRGGKPLIAAECKAPQIELDNTAAMQLAVYNKEITAPHLILTNGKKLIFMSRTTEKEYALRSEIPDFEQLIAE